jgi:hypothetical protein
MGWMLFSLSSCNVLDEYETETAAIAAVGRILAAEPEAAGQIAVAGLDENGDTIASVEGDDLVRRACGAAA